MVHDFLAENGLADFSAATEPISNLFAGGRTMLAGDSPPALAVADLMYLNAAEASLPTALERHPSGPVVVVPEQAARFAIVATNSGPFVGHDVTGAPKLWDVTLFGSDASKLAWLADDDAVEVVRDRFMDVISRLFELYGSSDDDLHFGGREAFAMRAALWRAKIAVLLQEDSPAEILDVARFTELMGAG